MPNTTELADISQTETPDNKQLEKISKPEPLTILLGVGGAILWMFLCFLAFNFVKTIIPNEIELSLFGLNKSVGEVHERIANIGILLFLIFPLCMLIELLLVGVKKSSIYRIFFAQTDSIKLDISCVLLSAGQITSIINLVLTFGLASIVGKSFAAFLANYGIVSPLSKLPIYLQIPLFYTFYTFFDYWTHRIAHARIFWPFHRFHHSAKDFVIITTMRQHPADFLGIFIINLPMAALGASVSTMIWVMLIVQIIGAFQHSNINSDYGFIGKYFIQSPNHHRKHHILDLSEPVGHFSMMPLWDRLFGTLAGTSTPDLIIGVDKPYRHGYSYIIDVMRDYIDFWRGLFGAKVDPYDFDAAKPK